MKAVSTLAFFVLCVSALFAFHVKADSQGVHMPESTRILARAQFNGEGYGGSRRSLLTKYEAQVDGGGHGSLSYNKKKRYDTDIGLGSHFDKTSVATSILKAMVTRRLMHETPSHDPEAEEHMGFNFLP